MFKLHEIAVPGFERIFCFKSLLDNIQGIIAVHSTVGGPALGGCRIREYSTFTEGLEDVLNLAEAMTYKNTLLNLPYGGGKAVIFKTSGLNINDTLQVFGNVLNYLEGIYITTDDIGTSVKDMEYLRTITPYAKGILYKGKQIQATSYGVYQAIKAAFFYKTGNKELKGTHVIVQGLGKTGFALCEYLYREGCVLYVDDLNPDLVKKAKEAFGASYINISSEQKISADIFCPCAVGGTITHDFIKKLSVRYIAGSANNQLQHPSFAEILHEKNILYIPDYLCNAGGVIDIFCEGESYSKEYVFEETDKIYEKTLEILEEAEILKTFPLKIADRSVQEKLQQNMFANI